MLLALKLRLYHLGVPSTGMHNMKENEYLSAAQGALEHGDFLRRRTHIHGLSEHGSFFEEYPQIPFLPWGVFASWELLGRGFWQARLPIVLTAVATVPALHALAAALTGSALAGVVAAFLLAIVPEHVFFGRNLQPEAPALLFAILGSAAAFRFLAGRKKGDAVLAGLLFALAGALKYSFLVLVLPLVAVALEELRRRNGSPRRTLHGAALFALPFVPLFLWTAVIAPRLNVSEGFFEGTLYRVRPWEVFTPDYWARWGSLILRYAVVDHTAGILVLALLGLGLALWRGAAWEGAEDEDGAHALRPYVAGSLGALVLYAAVFSDYLRGHSYYQFPFLPLVCVAASLPIAAAASVVRRVGSPALSYALAALFVLGLVPAAARATNAHFDTVFFGVDVTASFLNGESAKEDRVFVFGHQQALAVCYNADRLGARNPTAAEMTRGEARLGFRWAFVHVATGGLDVVRGDAAVLSHLEDGYELAQMTFFRRTSGEIDVQTLLLRRGGRSDLRDIARNPLAASSRAAVHPYETTRGRVDLLSVSTGVAAR
jgi:4-amino-4-deoxy-L-arabinose transferase-like glycosyltransferase